MAARLDVSGQVDPVIAVIWLSVGFMAIGGEPGFPSSAGLNGCGNVCMGTGITYRLLATLTPDNYFFQSRSGERIYFAFVQ